MPRVCSFNHEANWGWTGTVTSLRVLRVVTVIFCSSQVDCVPLQVGNVAQTQASVIPAKNRAFPILRWRLFDQRCNLLRRKHVFFNIPSIIPHRTHRVLRAWIDLDIASVVSRFEWHPQSLDCVIHRWRCEPFAFQCVAPGANVSWCDLTQEAISFYTDMGEKLICCLRYFQ